MLSPVQLSVAPWTVGHQAPLSTEFSRQEYWSALPFPPPEDLPDPGAEPTSPAFPALLVHSLLMSHWGRPYLLLKKHWKGTGIFKKKTINKHYFEENKQTYIESKPRPVLPREWKLISNAHFLARKNKKLISEWPYKFLLIYPSKLLSLPSNIFSFLADC